MILVTDATGRIGSAVLRDLLADTPVPIRAIVPGRWRALRFDEHRVDLVVGSVHDPRTVERAVRDVDTVVLITTSAPEDLAAQERLVDQAAAGGVRTIVKLSTLGAAPDACYDSARWHWRVEQRMAASGLEAISVRAARPFQAIELQAPLVLTTGLLTGCQGRGTTADVDARDVAAVLAALTQPDRRAMLARAAWTERVDRPDGPGLLAFDVTGPDALSRAQFAALLQRFLGRPVAYVDCAATQLLQCAQAAGLPPWQAQDLVAFESHARAGHFSAVSAALATLLPRPPRTADAFAHEFATSMRYSRAPASYRDDTGAAARLPRHRLAHGTA